MADEILNMSEVTDSLNQTLLEAVEPLVAILQIVGIALLVYIVFLILKAFFRWRTLSKIGKMSKNVEEINNKMDVLIDRLGKDSDKKKKKGKK